MGSTDRGQVDQTLRKHSGPMRGHDDVLVLADVGDARIDARAVKYVKSAHSISENVYLKTPPAVSRLARKFNRRALEVSHAAFDRRN